LLQRAEDHPFKQRKVAVCEPGEYPPPLSDMRAWKKHPSIAFDLAAGTLLRSNGRQGIGIGGIMKTSLVGLVGLLCASALPINAVAQERPERARNQPLQEQLKTLEVRTAIANASTPSTPKTNDVETGVNQKQTRPVVIEGPGYYRGMSSAPSNR
jgi:hypothetical protein